MAPVMHPADALASLASCLAAYDVCGFTRWASDHDGVPINRLEGNALAKEARPSHDGEESKERFANLAIDIYATDKYSDAGPLVGEEM